MMQGRRAGAAGQGDQGADVTADDAHSGPITPEDAHELAELEVEDAEIRRAAESLERRRHDLELRDALVAEGFDGPLWRRFAEELARYGHAALMAWQRTGAIFAYCRRKHRPIGTAPPTWTDQDRIDLASDTVVSAIATFRDNALARGGWTFEGGASLKTYFIGACVLAYPSIYRGWKSRHLAEIGHRSLGGTGDLDGLGEPLLQPIGDPSGTTVRWNEIARGLEGMRDDRTRLAVVASALGYTNEEIADLLEVSEGAVKQILHRHRRRAGKGESA